MALSNAERQKRYRERRNATAARATEPPMEALREALVAVYAEDQDDEAEAYREAAEDVIADVANQIGRALDELKRLEAERIAVSFGLPANPWPGLTENDLAAMLTGRKGEGKHRGLIATGGTAELCYSRRLRALRNREWLNEGA